MEIEKLRYKRQFKKGVTILMITLKNISRAYGKGKGTIHALRNVNLKINAGEMVAIMGKSGSGKTTLLNTIGLLDKSFEGEYFINDINVKKLSEKQKAFYRNEFFGFVVQDFALIEKYTVFENIKIPFNYTKKRLKKKELIERIETITTKLGINDKLKEPAYNLSGGQRQRVAIARAIINNPKIILADEPTGALDSDNAKEIMNLLKRLNNEGKTIIVVTHDEEVSKYCDYVINIKDGEII